MLYVVWLYNCIEKETKFSIKEIAMERNLYLDKLIRRKNNGMIKVITGACVKIGLNQEKPYK